MLHFCHTGRQYLPPRNPEFGAAGPPVTSLNGKYEPLGVPGACRAATRGLCGGGKRQGIAAGAGNTVSRKGSDPINSEESSCL
jgi:hypothetical protein